MLIEYFSAKIDLNGYIDLASAIALLAHNPPASDDPEAVRNQKVAGGGGMPLVL